MKVDKKDMKKNRNITYSLLISLLFTGLSFLIFHQNHQMTIARLITLASGSIGVYSAVYGMRIHQRKLYRRELLLVCLCNFPAALIIYAFARTEDGGIVW